MKPVKYGKELISEKEEEKKRDRRIEEWRSGKMVGMS
jgi:hypothetical protein